MSEALDFKSATLYAVRLVLHSADPQRLEEALAQRMKDAGGFFENEPVVIDASRLEEETLDWPRLLAVLQSHKLPAIGVVAEGGNLEAARAAGLVSVDLSATATRVAPWALAIVGLGGGNCGGARRTTGGACCGAYCGCCCCCGCWRGPNRKSNSVW